MPVLNSFENNSEMLTVSENCENLHNDQECEDWARGGECEINPSWMIPNCRKACQKCGDDKGL